jgi:hypothetical protein
LKKKRRHVAFVHIRKSQGLVSGTEDMPPLMRHFRFGGGFGTDCGGPQEQTRIAQVFGERIGLASYRVLGIDLYCSFPSPRFTPSQRISTRSLGCDPVSR